MSDEEEDDERDDDLAEEDDEPLDDDGDADGGGGSAASSRAERVAAAGLLDGLPDEALPDSDELVDLFDDDDGCYLLAERRADGCKRKTERRQGAQDQWDTIVEDVDEAECQASIAATALVELDGAESWPGIWKPNVGLQHQGLPQPAVPLSRRGLLS